MDSTDQQFADAVTNALTAKDTRIKQLEDEVKNTQTTTATALVENAIAEGKVKAEDKDRWIKMAMADYELASNTLSGIQGTVDVNNLLKKTGDKPTEVVDKNDPRASWTYQDYINQDQGALNALQADNPTKYQELENAHYGVQA